MGDLTVGELASALRDAVSAARDEYLERLGTPTFLEETDKARWEKIARKLMQKLTVTSKIST